MKRTASLALLLAFFLCLFANAETDFDYMLLGDGACIIRYLGTAEDVVLPEIVEDKPVLSVATGAFRGTPAVNVTVPESFVSIENGAMGECESLRRVTILSDDCTIAAYAFSGCSDDLVLVGREQSNAHRFAVINGYAYEAIEETDVGLENAEIDQNNTVQPNKENESTAQTQPNVPKATSDESALCSFHDYSGIMPFEFADNSYSENPLLQLTYRVSDYSIVDEYINLFSDADWQIAKMDSAGKMVYMMAQDMYRSIVVLRYPEQNTVIFVFDPFVDYLFDPINGL